MKKFKAMTIRLSADQAENLNTIATVQGQAVAQVIRSAISDHIDECKNDSVFQEMLRQRIDRARQLLPDDEQ